MSTTTKSKRPALNWNPVRRGSIYCSSACGANCTHANFVLATKRAQALAKRLGKGWTTQVWENCAWHSCAISPCGRIKVHFPYGHIRNDGFTAFLGKSGES